MRAATACRRSLRWSAASLLAGSLLPALAAAATLHPGDFVMVTWGGGSCCRVLAIDATSLAVADVASGGYLADPADIAVSGDGGILVTVPASGIVRIDPATGDQSLFAPLGALGAGTPAGLLVVPGGEVYVTMQATQPRVLRLSADGSAVSVVSSGGHLQAPAGLALGPDGALYVCETEIPVHSRYAKGSLVRVDPGSGAQSLIATGDPLYSPFDLAFAPDGSLWSIQRGYLFDGYEGCIVRTRVTDGFSEQNPWGYCRTKGIAIRGDGVTMVADCVPIQSTCYYPRTMLYPSLSAFTDLAGPLAVVPGGATPASRTSWSRLKITYR